MKKHDHAFPLQLAKEAIIRGKYPDAINLIKPLSESPENSDALFLHAYLHFWDDDLSRTAAIEKMQQAAALDHAEANYVLAACPAMEPGYRFRLPQTAEQFHYLQKAAELGSIIAQTDLAECYLEGIHVEADAFKARELLSTIYDKGEPRYARTCFLLGQMELFGQGGSKNERNGIHKLSRARNALGYTEHMQAVELARAHVNDDVWPGFEKRLRELERHWRSIETLGEPLWQGILAHYCINTLIYDLRGASLEACMDFVFDHYPSLLSEDLPYRWHEVAKVIFDPPELIRLYTQIFQNADLLPDRYDNDQIKQGFEFDGIRGWGNFTVGCLISNAQVPIDDAVNCIHAMYDLFIKLFREARYQGIGYMWWDLGYGRCGIGSRRDPDVLRREWTKEDVYRVNQATFNTIVRVLDLKSYDCQRAAVHALRHSNHPERISVLQKFLDDHPDLPAVLRESALHAIKVNPIKE